MTDTAAITNEMEHLDQLGGKAFDGFQILSIFTHLAGRPQGRLARPLAGLLLRRSIQLLGSVLQEALQLAWVATAYRSAR